MFHVEQNTWNGPSRCSTLNISVRGVEGYSGISLNRGHCPLGVPLKAARIASRPAAAELVG